MRVKSYENVIPKILREKISFRYRTITKALNKEFWENESETSNTRYVGSYGRNTAISTSDIDILAELPIGIFDDYNRITGNDQSRLLQTVRKAIKSTYPNSNVRADGQVVKINFSDGIQFEILPAFRNSNGTFIYPDSNMGGNWKSTNPIAEQTAIRDRNQESNNLLVSTCRHMRYIRDNFFKSYHLSGIVIDSFVYDAIGGWYFTENTSTSEPGTYERNLLSYYKKNKRVWTFIPLKAPGSQDEVPIENSMECLEKVINYMTNN